MLRLTTGLTALLLTTGGALAAAVPAAPAGLAAPPPAAVADTAPPVLGDVTVTPDAVAVSGLDLVPVTVAVRLTDESGVIEIGDGIGATSPFVILERVSGGTKYTDGAELRLTSGTAQDGVWSATIQVPSTWSGRWAVSRVRAVDGQGRELDVDPRGSGPAAEFTVKGTHVPAVSMQFVPDPLVGDGRLTLKGRFYYQDTGKGIPHQPIFFGYDNQCVEHPSPANGSTAADGTFSKVYPKGDGHLRCVGILRPSNIVTAPAFIVATSGHPRVKPVVTASADRTAVPPGTKVTFTGTVAPWSVTNVQLQEKVDGAWRTVAEGSVGDASRFSLAVTPKGTGAHHYRVTAPSDVVGVSRTIVVQVNPAGSGAGDGDGSGTLPITGSPVSSMAGGGLVLVVAGIGLALLGRRRRVAPVPVDR
ncbi:hypothetical protein [Micromonospora sp. NPDC023956]|uniref:hypothetical protein n=1 Tax=Micromonospora sp. NPDC023956 TaxID=3155722 RepID=UPI003411A782